MWVWQGLVKAVGLVITGSGGENWVGWRSWWASVSPSSSDVSWWPSQAMTASRVRRTGEPLLLRPSLVGEPGAPEGSCAVRDLGTLKLQAVQSGSEPSLPVAGLYMSVVLMQGTSPK